MKALNIGEQAKRCCRVCVHHQSPDLGIKGANLETYSDFDTVLSG